MDFTKEYNILSKNLKNDTLSSFEYIFQNNTLKWFFDNSENSSYLSVIIETHQNTFFIQYIIINYNNKYFVDGFIDKGTHELVSKYLLDKNYKYNSFYKSLKNHINSPSFISNSISKTTYKDGIKRCVTLDETQYYWYSKPDIIMSEAQETKVFNKLGPTILKLCKENHILPCFSKDPTKQKKFIVDKCSI